MRNSTALAAAAVVLAAVMASAAPQRSTPAPPPARDAAATLPAGNLDHGRYLVERVAMCIECHSERDGEGRIIEGRQYLGGVIPFAPPWSNDWATRAPRNRGLPAYDDRLALRLLTEGSIGRDGQRLRPPMPRFFMTRQDAADVIAFLRSLR